MRLLLLLLMTPLKIPMRVNISQPLTRSVKIKNTKPDSCDKVINDIKAMSSITLFVLCTKLLTCLMGVIKYLT